MTDEKGETFFVGKDVATALGYKNPSNALQVHVDEEDKTSYLIQVSGSNYKANTLMINESVLYALVLSSKLPQAKVFKHWVTSEVLPQIRKMIHRICKTEEIMIPFILNVEISEEGQL